MLSGRSCITSVAAATLIALSGAIGATAQGQVPEGAKRPQKSPPLGARPATQPDQVVRRAPSGISFGPQSTAQPDQTPNRPPNGVPLGPRPTTQTNRVTEARILTAPSGLNSTVDPQVCSQHGGAGAGFACKAVLENGSMVLVWTHGSGVGVLGYRIYLGGSVVAVQQNGPEVTFKSVPAPSAGACYVVTAFSASDESPPSAAYCPGGGAVVQSVQLQPKAFRSAGRVGVRGGNDAPTVSDQSDAGQALVGFVYNTFKGAYASSDMANNSVHRLGIYFDLSSLNNHRILSARLRITVDSAWTKPFNWTTWGQAFQPTDPPEDHSTSCEAKLGVGTDRWWQYGGWINAAVVSTGQYNGPDIVIDVTPTVAQWTSYGGATPNMGFVLIGPEENLGAFTEEACLTSYLPGSIVLDVRYN